MPEPNHAESYKKRGNLKSIYACFSISTVA